MEKNLTNTKFRGQFLKKDFEKVYGPPVSWRYWVYTKRPADRIRFGVMANRYLELNDGFGGIVSEEQIPAVYTRLRSEEFWRFGFSDPIVFSSRDRIEAGHSGIGVVFTKTLYPAIYPVNFDDSFRYPIIPDLVEFFRSVAVNVSILQEKLIHKGVYFANLSPVTPGSIRQLNIVNRQIWDNAAIAKLEDESSDTLLTSADEQLEELVLMLNAKAADEGE